MAVINGVVYMWGGYTSGYDCSFGITDTSSMGDTPAGLPLKKCRIRKGMSQELWRYDPVTTTWEHVTILGVQPIAREQHSASVVEGKMYVFGGLTESQGRPYLNDLWHLDPGTQSTYTSATGKTGLILEGVNNFFTASVPVASDQCIANMQVEVTINHPCSRQLKVFLWGPGPNTHDAYIPPPNHKGFSIKLFESRDGTFSGCGKNLINTVFDDSAPRLLGDCCPSPFTGRFKPEDRLYSFYHLPARGPWSLQVLDDTVDGRNGSVVNWTLSFTLERCTPTYTWTRINTTNTPPARYQHSAIAVDTSLFIMGGRGDARFLDIWRIDLGTSRRAWVKLMPASTWSNPLEFYGRGLALTPWGLMAYGGTSTMVGGYIKSSGGPNSLYSNNVWIQDVVRERWSVVSTTTEGNELNGHPSGRYQSPVAFVPQASRAEGGEWSFSSHGSMSSLNNMSMLIFGGHDGLRCLDDLWELRLDAYNGLQDLESKHDDSCKWRLLTNGTAYNTWMATCMTNTPSKYKGTCRPQDILIQAYCREQYQSINNM